MQSKSNHFLSFVYLLPTHFELLLQHYLYINSSLTSHGLLQENGTIRSDDKQMGLLSLMVKILTRRYSYYTSHIMQRVLCLCVIAGSIRQFIPIYVAPFTAPQSIASCLLYCAISTTAKDINDLINLLESIFVMMLGISKLYVDLYWWS